MEQLLGPQPNLFGPQEVKKQSNDLVLGMYPELKTIVFNSVNQFDSSLRLAIAGNIIDYGVSNDFDLQGTINLARRHIQRPSGIGHHAATPVPA